MYEYISKPNSFTLHHHHTTITPPSHHHHTTSHHHHHHHPPHPPPATCRQAKGGGVVSYPSKVQFLDPFLEIRGPWKNYVKTRMFWHLTFCRKNSSKSSQNGVKSDILFVFLVSSKLLNSQFRGVYVLSLAFDPWFCRYLSWPDTLLKLLGHFGVNQRWLK